VYIENGTYTAVRRRAPYHCTPSPPEAMPLPNQGVLSAGPCSRRYIQLTLEYTGYLTYLGVCVFTLKELYCAISFPLQLSLRFVTLELGIMLLMTDLISSDYLQNKFDIGCICHTNTQNTLIPSPCAFT